MTVHAPLVPEFSRPLNVDSIGATATHLELRADAGERANLARRFDLLRLDSLAATVHLERSEAGNVLLSGQLKAEVVQTCVVTLEPVRATIDARFTRVFARSPRADEEISDEIFLDPEADEPPEHLEGDIVDVGEVVAETLGLEIDPFPRAPGAVFAQATATPTGTEKHPEISGPFAALAKLKERR